MLAGDELAHGLDRVDAERDRAARRLHSPVPNALFEADLAERDERKAAVAARGAPADLVGLEDDGVETMRSGQPIGGREPGVAAADHGDVRAAIALERPDTVWLGSRRRRPVRGDVVIHGGILFRGEVAESIH